MKPTPFLIKVLSVIADCHEKDENTSPSRVASKVFPREHPGWRRACKCGPKGTTFGSGLVMMIGGYMGRLQRPPKPLIYVYTKGKYDKRAGLTDAGEKMLKDHRNLIDTTKAA